MPDSVITNVTYNRAENTEGVIKNGQTRETGNKSLGKHFPMEHTTQ